MSIRKLVVAAFAFSVALPGLAQAPFPGGSVRIVVPYTPGSTADVVGRILAMGLEQRWKQPVIVDNRAGAGGRIAMEYVARAAPDGLTMALVNTAFTTMPYLYKDLSFRPEADFAAVSLVNRSGGAVCVPTAIPARDLKEFVAWVKANPQNVNYASPGVGTIVHLLFEMINAGAGIHMVHVPYPGPAQYTQALLRNDVQLIYIQVPPAVAAQKAGRMRVIAVVGDVREPDLPDVPSLKESGWFDYVPTPWQGLVAPLGTPKSVIDKVAADTRSVLLTPSVAQQIKAAVGADVIGGSPEDLHKLLQTEFRLWSGVIKRLAIQAQ